jgi:predicted PurR-regulated permease PerM
MAFTGSVDNVVKPLFLRGNTRIHPLLIFLAVFGGLSRFGVPGALVGPLIVAFFLAAYTIYQREYLGWVPPAEPPEAGWIARARRVFRRSGAQSG